MSLIIWIVIFTALGGVLSALVAGMLLLLSASLRTRLLTPLVSFAIGALLGAVFLDILPEVLTRPTVSVSLITSTILAGLLVFFLLEKMVLWRHCHIDHCETHNPHEDHGHSQASGYLILIGDGIHNFVDGILLAAAFLTDIRLGVITSFAITAHEIPQELGSFAVLLNNGFSKGRALIYNLISSLTMVLGGVVGYISLSWITQGIPYILAVAASSFIYIAVADLIPGLHKRIELSATLQQILLILAGITIIFVTNAELH